MLRGKICRRRAGCKLFVDPHGAGIVINHKNSDPTMEELQSINEIVSHYNIKTSTVSIFCLDEVVAFGKGIQRLQHRPTAPICSNQYDLVFDLGRESFCSIFLEDEFRSDSRDMESSSHWVKSEPKLVSDPDILSSDFDIEALESILTSEAMDSDHA